MPFVQLNMHALKESRYRCSNVQTESKSCRARFAIEEFAGDARSKFDGYDFNVKHQTPSLESCARAG